MKATLVVALSGKVLLLEIERLTLFILPISAVWIYSVLITNFDTATDTALLLLMEAVVAFLLLPQRMLVHWLLLLLKLAAFQVVPKNSSSDS
ncbi:MAG: hypothetical protein K2L14_00495 [Duncaniella sp.]|nr:hypothetical protein [Duncaniella sp.]